jgi:aminoglycoside phosphotransferase (APT) family kinase protein
MVSTGRQLSSVEISEKLMEYLQDHLCDSTLSYQSYPEQILGGYYTTIYRFQLKNAPKDLSHPLILRVYPPRSHPNQAIRETKVQNTLNEMGYPAPKVHFVHTDTNVFAGIFIIMDWIIGEQMMTAPPDRVPELLAEAHVHLHNLDSSVVMEKMAEAGIYHDDISLKGHLSWLQRQIGPGKLEWLMEGLDWVLLNKPIEPRRLSICHGDFHPLNILVHQGVVSGVLDWSGFLVTDPAYDVGSTKVILGIAAPSVIPGIDFDSMTKRYIDLYLEEIPLETEYIEFHEAYRCLRAFREGAMGQEIWTHPDILRRLTNKFHEITGIEIKPPEQE